MLTLTIDPKRFGSEAEGHRYLGSSRLVGESMSAFARVLGKKRGELAYHAVKQFHKRGSVHVHVLIDGLGFVPKKRLQKLQVFCQRRLGTCDYKYMGTERAIDYVTRYVSKSGEVPGWVRGPEGQGFHWTSSSHGYWGADAAVARKAVVVVDWRAFEESVDPETGELCHGGLPDALHEELDKCRREDDRVRREEKAAGRLTMEEREERCGTTCVVMRRKPVGNGWEFVASLPVAYWALRGFLGTPEGEYLDAEVGRSEDGAWDNSVEYLEFWIEERFVNEFCELVEGDAGFFAPGQAGGTRSGPPGSELSLGPLNHFVEGGQLSLDRGWGQRWGV